MTKTFQNADDVVVHDLVGRKMRGYVIETLQDGRVSIEITDSPGGHQVGEVMTLDARFVYKASA